MSARPLETFEALVCHANQRSWSFACFLTFWKFFYIRCLQNIFIYWKRLKVSCAIKEMLFKISLQPASFYYKGDWLRCFPVIFTKNLRTAILKNKSGWLLLKCQAWTRALLNTNIFVDIEHFPVWILSDPMQKQSSPHFFKIGVLINFVNLTVKHLCWSISLI